jgi:hypothetical protein
MPTSPTPERCPRCDRAECAFHNASDADVRRGSLDGLSDCHDNRVDWRARCLAAEKREADERERGVRDRRAARLRIAELESMVGGRHAT